MKKLEEKSISIISPIKTPEEITLFSQNSKCSIFYVYYHKFLNNNFEKIHQFIQTAMENNAKIYVNFKHNILEDELIQITKFIKYLKATKINGIFVNSYAILKAIKGMELPFKLIIDSYFDIHNIAGIEFLKSFQRIDGLILTEEIYTKNIAKIKKFSNIPLAIDTDNLPWCIDEIKQNGAISYTVIKGDFNSSKEVLNAINYIEKIIDKPDEYKNKKLPFKHVRKGLYKTNHFSGEIFSSQGKDFKFSKHLQPFEWESHRSRLKKDFDYSALKTPNLCLRLSAIEQIKKLKYFIEKMGFNPVFSIEYGEIVSTTDLAKRSFTQVIDYVKNFCQNYNIFLSVSTPKILIERDFDRVYEYMKQICLEKPKPNAIIVNNIGYFWNIINDPELNNVPIEAGYGLNLLNSMSIECLNELHKIDGVDLSVIKDKDHIEHSLKKIKKDIPRRKLTIAGNIRIPCLGLCPLNTDSAINSRLSCKAPCHKGKFAIKDPSLNKIYPFIADGFCTMHMYKDELMNLFSQIDYFKKLGINEFVIDMSNLEAKFVPILLTNWLNSCAHNVQFEINDGGEYKFNVE